MIRAAIYARFSTDRQSESSAEDQARLCRERADREGWEIAGVYSDLAISGTSNTRPGLNALLEAADRRELDIMLTEAIDRISRNQADIASIYQRLEFAGVRIITLSEGEINELHIGLKGTMNALFLKDLGDKIRRGQRGRVATGHIPGGLSYGYRVVTGLDERGELRRGEREVDEAQAVIVRRIYREFLAGISPRAIAHKLNAEGVPTASGGEWRPTTIVGSRSRQNGILHNPAYAGRYIFNRVRMVRDPISRKRISRINPPSEWVTQDLPHLRIVDEATWEAVQRWRDAREGVSFRQQPRAKHLLSGLVVCGNCGGNVTILSRDRWGCVRHKDAGTCDNGRRISTERLESRIIGGLRRHLLSPEALSLAVREYHDRRTKRRAERLGSRAEAERRVNEAKVAIARLVDAIADGAADFSEVREALAARRADRERAEQLVAEFEAEPVIALHPHIVDAYRKRVDQLGQALASGAEGRATAMPLLRSLLEKVTITPNDADEDGLAIEGAGSLNDVLGLAMGKPAQTARPRTIQVVAEEGLEPPTRGL